MRFSALPHSFSVHLAHFNKEQQQQQKLQNVKDIEKAECIFITIEFRV